MSKNKITIISRNEYQNADIETQSKQFFIDHNKIHYENKLQISENKHGPTQGINVINQLCRVYKNNKLSKTTFVYFEDKVIKIQDEFYLQNAYTNVKVDSQIYDVKKPTHPQQSHRQNKSTPTLMSAAQAQHRRKKKDLKNIVKNIVKIFLQWLNKYPKKEICTGSLKELLNFHKYNNSLIRAMSEIPQINEAFATFLATQSRDLVQSSRIHDKPTHLQKLKKYESVFGTNKKGVGQVTSGNGSNEGNSSENKNGSGSEDKEKFSMNEEQNENNLNGQKMFADPNGQMNENINNSKSSDSDKLFNSSNNGSSQNNRNKRSNASMKEEYNGVSGNNGDNQLFFSSGSDQ